jgi:hypothetical protein
MLIWTDTSANKNVDCPLRFAGAAQPDYHEICEFPLRQPLRGFAATALSGAWLEQANSAFRPSVWKPKEHTADVTG